MTSTALLRHPQGPSAVLHRRDLLAAGRTPAQVRADLTSGRLVRLHPGLYRTARMPDPGALAAAVASLDGVASHTSAAREWGLALVHDPPVLEVTVPRARSGRRRAGVRVRRQDLPPTDVLGDGVRVVAGLVTGIPTTDLVRTLLDLARVLPVGEAVATTDDALRQRLVRPSVLAVAALALDPGPGRRRVREVVALADGRAQSVLESLARVLLLRAGVAAPVLQHEISRMRVDLAWPEQRLVVELDGRAFHDDTPAARRDRRRGNVLAAHGWRVVRLTWDDVVGRPERTVALVREALAA